MTTLHSAFHFDAAASSTTPCLRNRHERLLQTLCFEAVGLTVVSPLFALAAGQHIGASFFVLAVLSVTVMAWSAFYNGLFDRIDHRLSGRVASDRPQAWRLVHALGLELSAVVFTWPLVVVLTSLGWAEALLAEAGLTLAYAAYGYVFHLVFDRLRPVRRAAVRS